MAEPASIADSSKPNAGRVYDFLLGGSHNFEVDRLAAQELLKFMPFFSQFAHLIRWFLGEAVRRLVADGYREFLDFASGLPTKDHIHQIAPADAKVIYSDIDPVTVAYGREIVKDSPRVRYVQADAAKPEDLLSSPVVPEMFAANRKIAIGFNGISWFLPDEKVAHSLKVLYDWAGPGSRLFISTFESSSTTSETMVAFMAAYEKLGQPGYPRTSEKMKELMGEWKVLPPGAHALEEWVEMDKTVAKQTQGSLGGLLRGVILGK
jgi:O-methyltransferase involved in polyketide biosynthesis